MKRRNSITIAVPASMVAEINNLRDKTTALGQLGRAAAIYRVDQIIIYRDQPDENIIMKYILGYMETPQYLRKHLFDVRPELQYAGTLPPLRTPHHPLEESLSQIDVGSFRDGVVLGGSGFTYNVDIGIETPIEVRGKSPTKGARVTIEVMEKDPKLSGRAVKKKDIPEYWGYDLRGNKRRLSDLVHSPEWDLTIGTSRLGDSYDGVKERLEADWIEAEKTLIVFGSYKEGVGEMIERDGRKPEEVFDYMINTIPGQGTAAVRTEEAVMSTLAILNTLKE
ncbi:MAG: RNA methyltransferase [Candidatus Bathyarchaeota archaeon]|nr:RNA methyltransferase [Candidatus Bathyarchaeota archaeon]